jgi:hypothetical protein
MARAGVTCALVEPSNPRQIVSLFVLAWPEHRPLRVGAQLRRTNLRHVRLDIAVQPGESIINALAVWVRPMAPGRRRQRVIVLVLAMPLSLLQAILNRASRRIEAPVETSVVTSRHELGRQRGE